MNTSAQSLPHDRAETAADPQIFDLGWTAALTLADSLIGGNAGRATLGFSMTARQSTGCSTATIVPRLESAS